DHREVGGIAADAATQLAIAGLEQMVERALLPFLRRFPLAGGAELDHGIFVGLPDAPLERAALINRMQRIDDDDRLTQANAGVATAAAESLQQFNLGAAGESALDDPGIDGADSGGGQAQGGNP